MTRFARTLRELQFFHFEHNDCDDPFCGCIHTQNFPPGTLVTAKIVDNPSWPGTYQLVAFFDRRWVDPLAHSREIKMLTPIEVLALA